MRFNLGYGLVLYRSLWVNPDSRNNWTLIDEYRNKGTVVFNVTRPCRILVLPIVNEIDSTFI